MPQPTLTPVDGDPFAAPAARKPSLTPVDGDPFVQSSTAGTAGRAAVRGTLPALAGAAGFGTGFAATGTALAGTGIDLTGPWGWALHLGGSTLGGIAAAMGSGYVADKAQDKALSVAPAKWVKAIGQDDAQRQADVQQHPTAAFAGSLAPMMLSMRPGWSVVKNLPEDASLLTRALAHPASGSAIGAGTGAALETGGELYRGEKLDPTRIGLATAAGAVLNRPTRLGSTLFQAGGNTAIRAMQAGVGGAGWMAREAQAAAASARNARDLHTGALIDGEARVIEPRQIEGPKVTPVDGDPFATARAARPHPPPSRPAPPAALVPVPGDPFAPPAAHAPAPAAPAAPLPEPPTPQTVVPAVGEGQAAPEPGTRMVRTPAGNSINTRMGVVDASQLQQAQGDNQNRDRSRDTTALQTQDIIAKFDPELLHEDPSTDRGAPIVGPDMAIDSGNGRVLALNQIYEGYPEQAQRYRDMIESRGFDTSGMERPILVQHRLTEMTPEERRQFVIDSNKDTKLELSPVERARSDADSITPDMLAKYAGGDLNSTANGEFVQAFNKRLTTGEMGNMIGTDRRLTATGQQRIENAVVAHAYGNPKLLERMMESSNDDIRSITGSLADVAAPWAKLRNAAKDGEVGPAYDITQQLTDAAARVSDARKRGIKPADLLGQADAFDPMDPATAELIRAFHNTAMTRSASRKAVSEFLQSYIAAASGAKATPGLFGDEPAKSPVDIIKGLLEARDNPHGAGLALEPKDESHAPTRTPSRNEGRDAREAPQGQEKASEEGQPRRGKGRTEVAAEGDGSGGSAGGVEDRGAYAPSHTEASFTDRQSVYDSAVRAIGLTPDKFNILPPARKVALLTKALERLTGVTVTLAEKMPLQHAIDQLLDAHQTLQGMASVLGIMPRALSLDGKLSLQLVKNASFLGMFQPGKTSITLPGRSNSFAHEWAHALDYHLLSLTGEQARGITGHIRSEGADFQPANLAEAFVNVLNAMYFDGAALAEKIMRLERAIQTTKSDKQRAGLQDQIDNIFSGRSQAKEKSRYWQGANSLQKGADSGYWTRPTEMFARAFEAWIAFKTANESFGNEFITKGDEHYAGSDAHVAKAYPDPVERLLIFDAMQKMMDALNAEQVLKASGGGEISPSAATGFNDVATPGEREELARASRKAKGFINRVLGPDLEAWNIRKENNRIDAADDARRPGDGVAKVKKALRGGNNVRSLAFSAASDGVKMVATRYGSKAVMAIHDHFAHDLGGTRHVDRVWDEAIDIRENKALNPVFSELAKHGSKGWIYKKLDEGQRDVLRTLLQGKDVADDMGLTRLASLMRTAYNDEWYHNKNANIDLGYVKDAGYLNRQTDRELVAGNPDLFDIQATKVYELVFDRDVGRDAEAIAADEGRLDTFMAIAKQHKIEGLKELRAALRKEDAGPEDIATLVDGMLEDVKNAYSVTAATEYRDAILHTETFPDFTPTSRLPNHEKRRALPGEADDLLKDFYNPDPVSAFVHYVHNSVRRTEWSRRFGAEKMGGQENEKGKALDAEMAAQGVSEADRRYVWQLVDRMAGRYRRTGFLANPGVAGFLSLLRIKGTLAMMGRAVTLSFFEPASLGIVAANPKYAVPAVFKTWANVLLKGSRDEQMEWARAHGFIKHHMLEKMQSMDRFGTSSDTPTRLDKLPSAMFRNTGLTFLTDASDAAVIDVSRRGIINDMSHRVATGGKRGAEAEKLMAELGVRDPKAFAKEIVDMNSAMPSEEWLNGPLGWDYSTVMARIARMTIQKPKAADLAPLGRNPLASYATYSITAFVQASYRHLFKRNAKIALRHMKAGDYSLLALFAAGTIGSIALLYTLNFLSSVSREQIFNKERQDNWENEGTWWQNNAQLAASRTFSFGAFDPVINTWTGLKYNRDLAYLPLGAYLGNDAQNAGKMAKMFVPGRNSRKTNSAENNAAQGLYGFAIAPSLAAVLSAAPGGPLSTVASGMLTSLVTSPQAEKRFAHALTGEKSTAKHNTWHPTGYDKLLDSLLGPVERKKKAHSPPK